MSQKFLELVMSPRYIKLNSYFKYGGEKWKPEMWRDYTANLYMVDLNSVSRQIESPCQKKERKKPTISQIVLTHIEFQWYIQHRVLYHI